MVSFFGKVFNYAILILLAAAFFCMLPVLLVIIVSALAALGERGCIILAAVFGLAVFAGLGWLVFRCCRFSIMQALAASFLYGAAMLIVKKYFGDPDNPKVLVMFAIFNALAAATGLFIGARNAQAAAKHGRAWQWFVFLCGLLFVYAAPGLLFGVVLYVVGLATTSFPRLLLGIPLTLISCVCLVTTFISLRGEK